MAETIQEAMKRVSSKQRPLFKGNALLTTQHLQYFKPLKTPQNVLDENILLKEIIIVNPLTSVVEVKGTVLLITPLDKGKYIKTYRTWTCNEAAKAIFNAMGVDNADTVLAVNVTKDYYDPESKKPIKGWNSESDRYLVRRSINPKYMDEIINFKITSIPLDDRYKLYTINSDLGDPELTSRDSVIRISQSNNSSIYSSTTLTTDPTNTYNENTLFPTRYNNNFNFTTVVDYKYEFTPKYNTTITDIVSFYEELVKGTLWNTNPQYSGRNPEILTDSSLRYGFKYQTYGVSMDYSDFSIDHDLYYRKLDDNYRVQHVKITGDEYIDSNYDLSPIFLNVHGQYKLWFDWVKDNVISDTHGQVTQVYVTNSTIDSENYFSEVSTTDKILHLRTPYRIDQFTKDVDGNTFGIIDPSYNNSYLLTSVRQDSNDILKYSHTLVGAFYVPVEDSDVDYTIKFMPNSKVYNSANYGANIEKLRTRLEKFRNSEYYWDDNFANSDEELDNILDNLYNKTRYDVEFSGSPYGEILDPFSGMGNQTLMSNGLAYLLKNIANQRYGKDRRSEDRVDEYGTRYITYDIGFFLHLYHLLRCRLASLISGVGSWHLTKNALAPFYKQHNFKSLFVGGEYDYEGMAGIDAVIPAEPLYDRIILGIDDYNEAESLILSYPLAKRMTIIYKGIDYHFHNASDGALLAIKDIVGSGKSAVLKKFPFTIRLFIPTFGDPSNFLRNENGNHSEHISNVAKYLGITNFTGLYVPNHERKTMINTNNTTLDKLIPNMLSVMSLNPIDGSTIDSLNNGGYDKIKDGQQVGNKDHKFINTVYHGDYMDGKKNSGDPTNFSNGDYSDFDSYTRWCIENNLSTYISKEDDLSTVYFKDLFLKELNGKEISVTLTFNRYGLDPNLMEDTGEEVSRTYVTTLTNRI